VIDDERNRHERFDQGGRPTHAIDRGSHRSEVDEERNSGEVLENDARDDEWNFGGAVGVRLPVGELHHIPFPHPASVDVAEERLENDPDADRQAGHRPDSPLLQLRQRVEVPGGGRADGKAGECAEGGIRPRAHRKESTIYISQSMVGRSKASRKARNPSALSGRN
jgi:hypothetical protein